MRITSEGSSAANVRRIEAVTGPVAVGLMREHDELLRGVADELRTQPEGVAAGGRAAARAGHAARRGRRSSNGHADAGELAAGAEEIAGAQRADRRRAGRRPEGADADRRPRQGPARRARPRSCSARAVDGRVHFVAAVTPALVARGVKAGRGRQGRRAGRGRRRRRQGHDGPGRRQGSRQAARGARRRARGDRERAGGLRLAAARALRRATV